MRHAGSVYSLAQVHTYLTENYPHCIGLIEKIEDVVKRAMNYLSLFIKDVVIIKEDLLASNGVIHIIDCIMFIQPSFQDDRLSPVLKESFPITSCCMQTSDEVSLWKLNTKK